MTKFMTLVGLGVLVTGMLACGGGDAVLRKNVRMWAPDHLRADGELFTVCGDRCTEEMKLNAYKSVASLVCTVDVAEKKKDTPACKCEKAASDEATKTDCEAFAQAITQ